MLIEFRCANFRSIREEQVFSLVASKADKSLPGCVIERKLPGISKLSFLKGAALYGANASGKSNLLLALKFLSGLVTGSATEIKPGEPTGAEPFKLDAHSASQPSVFEITFVAENVRYQFGLSVTTERVVDEYLIAYPKGAPQRWYHRTFNEATKEYDWAKPSGAFKHDRRLPLVTRENSLILSVGPQFNHLQLTSAFDWFKKRLHFLHLTAHDLLPSEFTTGMMYNPTDAVRLMSLMKSADIGVIGAEVSREHEELRGVDLPPASERVPKMLQPRIKLSHEAKDIEPVYFDFSGEESVGTQRFFSLIGPWLDLLNEGFTVFIDEIENSLHPVLVKELIKLLLSRDHNPMGAQVVFTTHNPILLETSLMRRDQIWFTEKSPEGTTHLYPLTDYKPRKDEALAKGYLVGRYGAIPYLPDGLKL